MNQFTYRPGSWQVVVEDGGVVAVPGDVAADRVERLAGMLRQGTPALTEVIDVLAAGSISNLGSFAVALTPGHDVRFAVRGPVTVRISGATGVETVSGAEVSTWSERYVADLRGFDLLLDEHPAEVSYAIRSGVVLAGAVRAGEGADGAVVAEEEPEFSGVPAEAPAGDAPVFGAAPAFGGAQTADAATEPEVAPVFAAAPVFGAAAALDDVSAVDDASSVDDTPTDEDDSEFDGVSVFDDLLAADPDEQAVADVPQENAPADAASEPALQTLLPTEFTFAPGTVDAVPADLPPSALEETVQFTPAPPPPPTGMPTDLPPPPGVSPIPPIPPIPPLAPPTADGLGDHDGATISLAEVRRLRAEAAGQPVSPDAPTELIPATSVAPSAHGRVRISTGQVIELDRTVIIGRRPRSTRASGDTMPHLVAVDSPQQDISRSHLEIRPEGDSVVVIDLRTTNGSTLIRPGVDPVRLHPGEHTLVLDGDVVDLGDGVTVAFEGLV